MGRNRGKGGEASGAEGSRQLQRDEDHTGSDSGGREMTRANRSEMTGAGVGCGDTTEWECDGKW